MTASIVDHPTPTTRLFRTIEAIAHVSAAVQPDRTAEDFTHVIQAGTEDEARTIAALLLINGTATTVQVDGSTARVVAL